MQQRLTHRGHEPVMRRDIHIMSNMFRPNGLRPPTLFPWLTLRCPG
jgi:hypothetical protein